MAEQLPRICLFARAPVLGRVKTRVAQAIGDERTLALYLDLADRALEEAVATGLPVDLWLAGSASNRYVQAWTDSYGVRVISQKGDNLGERMAEAVKACVGAGAGALVVGTDIPDLSHEYLLSAAHMLSSSDLVLGPVEDGGYCLIGMKEVRSELFDGISWGTSSVFDQTLDRARKCGLEVALLPQMWDLDTADDLARYEANQTSG
jgi:rSAM/selenodomain-associated transferase 1